MRLAPYPSNWPVEDEEFKGNDSSVGLLSLGGCLGSEGGWRDLLC